MCTVYNGIHSNSQVSKASRTDAVVPENAHTVQIVVQIDQDGHHAKEAHPKRGDIVNVHAKEVHDHTMMVAVLIGMDGQEVAIVMLLEPAALAIAVITIMTGN